METYTKKVCEDFEAELVEFNGESDHIHMLVNYPPKLAISKLVNSLKGVTSRRLRKDFPDLASYYWNGRSLWSRSYFVSSCGGASIDALRDYIENQDRPD